MCRYLKHFCISTGQTGSSVCVSDLLQIWTCQVHQLYSGHEVGIIDFSVVIGNCQLQLSRKKTCSVHQGFSEGLNPSPPAETNNGSSERRGEGRPDANILFILRLGEPALTTTQMNTNLRAVEP